MTEENREFAPEVVSEDLPNADDLPLTEELMPLTLNEESQALINQIIAESDEKKTQDLTHLFNNNQNKKTMVRVNKLSDLLDTITDQALTRFSQRPDEISNKELFDGLKIVQDLIERGQKQVSGAGEMPLIQVNNQNNEVNIGNSSETLSRDSRERVKAAVLGLLNSITPTEVEVKETKQEVYESEDSNIVEVEVNEE